MLRQALWGCALLLVASGCNAIRTFESTARVHGGHDGAGGEDLIFLELRNVEGLQAGAYAIRVPPDWAERGVHLEGEDRLVPEPPCRLTLIPGHDAVPSLELAESSSYGIPETYIRSEGNIPLLVFDRERALDPEAIQADTRKRLDVGGSAYAVVHEAQGSGLLAADLYGARNSPQGPGRVEWIWLGRIQFDDGRGFAGKTGDVLLRQTPNAVLGTVAAVYLAAIVTSPVWIWFVI